MLWCFYIQLFTGERDRVKCWYCNGGLQHWDYDDAPWVEHAKWFPNCQFLLSVKGQHFVYRHLTTSAYLSRPIIARQEGATVDPTEQGSGEPSEDIPPPSPGAPRGPTPPPTIVDPRVRIIGRICILQKFVINLIVSCCVTILFIQASRLMFPSHLARSRIAFAPM